MIILDKLIHNQVFYLHFGFLAIAIVSILVSVYFLRKLDKKHLKLKQFRVGDTVKFYTYCETDDCILSGKITDIVGEIIEVEVPEDSVGWNGCQECLGGSRKVNKHYTNVIS